MRVALSLLLAMALMPIVSMQTAYAQDNAVYVVSYVEVAPAARGTAVNLLRQLANASRKDEGNTRFDILQRTAPSNQFAIVAIWKDQKAYDAHLAPLTARNFARRSNQISSAQSTIGCTRAWRSQGHRLEKAGPTRSSW